MLKRFLIIFVPLTLCFIGLICYNVSRGPYESDFLITDDLISMSIKEGSLSNDGATIIIDNKTENTFNYSDNYWIEQNIKGTWYKLKQNPVNVRVMDSKSILKDTIELSINWKQLYGALKSGKYRIIKNFYMKDNDNINIYVSAEFEIS